jgi:serine/threonine kinase 32
MHFKQVRPDIYNTIHLINPSFTAETELLMIVDLMLGGALRYHLNHDKHFSEERCKFYVAQTALSLHYLHRRGLVHRDIKPDNLLLDAEGKKKNFKNRR